MTDETASDTAGKGAAAKPRGADTSAATKKASTMTNTLSSDNTTTGGDTALGTSTMVGDSTGSAGTSTHRTEAKSRFNAAVSEAKAGVAALKAEATERAGGYREQAGKRSQDLMADARTYGADAKIKGRDLATQGKGKVSEGLTALGQTISDNAYVVDEKLGAKYGDYARSASRSLQDAATRLDAKSIDELSEDARTFVRKSPGTAVGIAAVVGFMLSRLFSGSRR